MKYPLGTTFLILSYLLLPFSLLWLRSVGTLSTVEMLAWSMGCLAMVCVNVWNIGRVNRKKALEEIDKAKELMEKSQYRAANECLDKALVYDKTCFEVRVVRGEIFRSEQAYDKARRELMEALEINPNSFGAHFALGLVYLQEKKVYEAISEFKCSINLKPDFIESHFILAQAYELAGEKAKAVDSYKRYLKVVSGDQMDNKKVMDNMERCKSRITALQ